MLFLQKNEKIFKRWGLRPQTPVPPAAGGLAPPLRISGYAPVPHTGDRRFHATPSDVETRKKKEDSILRKFDSTKIQNVLQHER